MSDLLRAIAKSLRPALPPRWRVAADVPAFVTFHRESDFDLCGVVALRGDVVVLEVVDRRQRWVAGHWELALADPKFQDELVRVVQVMVAVIVAERDDRGDLDGL